MKIEIVSTLDQVTVALMNLLPLLGSSFAHKTKFNKFPIFPNRVSTTFDLFHITNNLSAESLLFAHSSLCIKYIMSKDSLLCLACQIRELHSNRSLSISPTLIFHLTCFLWRRMWYFPLPHYSFDQHFSFQRIIINSSNILCDKRCY